MPLGSGGVGIVRHSFGTNQATNQEVEKLVTPVVNTTAGEYKFKRAHRPLLLRNATGQALVILVNDTMANMEAGTLENAAALSWSHVVADGAVVDLSQLGDIAVKTASIWFATGATLADGSFYWWDDE